MSQEPSPLEWIDSPQAYLNRELSWLSFARRVLALVEDRDIPLLERVKFAGIMGMLHDEFFMKRMSGLKRQIQRGSKKASLDGLSPHQEFAACREELLRQAEKLGRAVREEILPGLAEHRLPILPYDGLEGGQKVFLREYFRLSVQPILTPLAVDAEHPFPFISNVGLNLAVLLPDDGDRERFVRIKMPGNRPRWVPLPGGAGFTPLEQVIAANLDLMFPSTPPRRIHVFRVTRGAEGDRQRSLDLEDEEELREPGSIVRLVSDELKARRFAGVVRLELDAEMPRKIVGWLSAQLKIERDDVYPTEAFLGMSDLLRLDAPGHDELRFPRHVPVTHPRLRGLDPHSSGAIFEEIARGDILLHHPYDDFDTAVLRFLESAAADPDVLAIKLTIYRTNADSPIVRALADAARRGKQVAVLVEITARFDEAPNIAWGQYLENEGVHVSYGVERLKTHVKLALVVREEAGRIRRYVHVGSGNYHTGTARIYEDVGILTCDPLVCEDAAAVYNELTGAIPPAGYRKLLLAPAAMRRRFVELIRREAENAAAGKPSGIHAKMNQLQDPEIIRELYRAGLAGVPIKLNVRGLCCLRPGVPGLSFGTRVFGVVGRFLEHSRIYRFENDGAPEFFIGSADWMKRNLDNRVETVLPVEDDAVKRELDAILEVYEQDNASAWDCGPDGLYLRRTPRDGEERRAAQEAFISRARGR
ncbi:MAG: polyphosphate kinase 1 [Acidobacteriia bacterium]|nr:polyphosphate kinase 1 [Terriglobia bacterium]